MKFNPYLNFDGTCAEAFAFYAELFGGTIGFIQTFGESPMKDDVPAEMHGAVMHASIDVRGQYLFGSDAVGEMYKVPQGMAVSIGLSDPAEAERIFAGLVKGGVETMALQQTFWAKRFGMCTDRFGIPWMVNCE